MKPAQLTQVIVDKIPSMRKSEAKVANLVLQKSARNGRKKNC